MLFGIGGQATGFEYALETDKGRKSPSATADGALVCATLWRIGEKDSRWLNWGLLVLSTPRESRLCLSAQ